LNVSIIYAENTYFLVLTYDDHSYTNFLANFTFPDLAPPTCTYFGQEYTNGSHFKSVDGCNICHCMAGSVSCTEIGCPGHVATANGGNYKHLNDLKGILSILDQNLDHRDFVYICTKLKEWRILNSNGVMFDT